MREMGKHAVGARPAAEQENQGGKKAKEPVDPYKDTYEWIHCIVVSVIICVLVFVLVARVIQVQGRSMLPNLEQGDRIIITRLAGDYEQGDIVVLKAEKFKNEPLVKRIIGTGGQTITLDFATGDITVDGQVLDEPYIFERTIDSYHIMDPQYYDVYGIDPEKDVTETSVTIHVPEGHLFCMGDNRNNSSDSRVSTIAYIDTRDVMGKAVFRLYPFHKMGAIYGAKQS